MPPMNGRVAPLCVWAFRLRGFSGSRMFSRRGIGIRLGSPFWMMIGRHSVEFSSLVRFAGFVAEWDESSACGLVLGGA